MLTLHPIIESNPNSHEVHITTKWHVDVSNYITFTLDLNTPISFIIIKKYLEHMIMSVPTSIHQ